MGTQTTAQNVKVLLELTLLLRMLMLRFYWNLHYCSECKGSIGTHTQTTAQNLKVLWHSHYCSECKGSMGTHTTAQNVKVLLEITLLLRM